MLCFTRKIKMEKLRIIILIFELFERFIHNREIVTHIQKYDNRKKENTLAQLHFILM